MLPNKFDQYFRDKLLDHSTKVSPNAWKMIHAGLLRHKTFHFWKWYMAGPAVVLVALTGYLILAKINKSTSAHAGTTAQTRTQPVTPPAQTAATGETTSPDITTSPNISKSPDITTTPDNTTPGNTTPGTTTPATATGANSPAPKTNSSTVADGTVHKTHTTSGTTAGLTSAATAIRIISNTNTRHSTNNHAAIRNHTRHGPRRQKHSSGKPTAQPPEFATLSTGPAVPHAGPITKPTIVRPAARLAITAITPNPRTPKNLVIPAKPYNHTSRWRLDGYASPEYFSFKEFGFSYGAGARATIVLKQHFTVTAGLQYLKVDVRAGQKDDSLNSLFPGIFNNIQVPLLLGYTTGNPRFSVSVNAGAIFSLYAEAKGRLKEQNNWPNHNGITSYLGFNFATRVGNRMSLFAEPYIKTWYPQKSQNLPPNLFSTGVSVGLRFDLK